MSSVPTPSSPPAEVTVESIVAVPVKENQLTTASYNLEVQAADLDKQRLHNRELSENIKSRGNWGDRIFWLVVGWLLSVVAIVALQGFTVRGFHLDNSVVIAFICTTTVNVLSLGYIVAKYLFPQPK